MGMFRHHAIIVAGASDEPDLVEVHRIAVSLFAPARVSPEHEGAFAKFAPAIVTPIMVAPYQMHASFAILPDGSKEGIDESNAFDATRTTFIDDHLRGRDLDWVEVAFGGDYAVQTSTPRHSGQDEYLDEILTTRPRTP